MSDSPQTLDDSIRGRSSNVPRNILLLFLAVGAVAALSAWLMPREIVPWRADYQSARHEAQAAGKPMLLYFTADWCGPCQRMKRTTWADAQVRDALAAYVPVRIDIAQSPDLAMQFHVQAIPRLIVLDANAAWTASHEGFIEPMDLLQMLRNAGSRP